LLSIKARELERLVGKFASLTPQAADLRRGISIGFYSITHETALRFVTATQRPPSGGLFVQCSGTEKNKKTTSKAGMPKTKGANSINMAHPGVRSSAWSSAPCFSLPASRCAQ